MNRFTTGVALAALGAAFVLTLPAGASAGLTCAKRDTVATGSSVVLPFLAKVDAEIAWELKAVSKYGPLWYSWWAAENHRFSCKTKGQRTICVARGKPCRLL